LSSHHLFAVVRTTERRTVFQLTEQKNGSHYIALVDEGDIDHTVDLSATIHIDVDPNGVPVGVEIKPQAAANVEARLALLQYMEIERFRAKRATTSPQEAAVIDQVQESFKQLVKDCEGDTACAFMATIVFMENRMKTLLGSDAVGHAVALVLFSATEELKMAISDMIPVPEVAVKEIV
jgi:uncharacterized protein YuzE